MVSDYFPIAKGSMWCVDKDEIKAEQEHLIKLISMQKSNLLEIVCLAVILTHTHTDTHGIQYSSIDDNLQNTTSA